MSASFKARDGSTINDGDQGTFLLAHGTYNDEHERFGYGKEGDPVTIEVTGTIRHFEQVERVYDDEHIAVSKTVEEHWEIVTGDPVYPAVGIRPENVLAQLS